MSTREIALQIFNQLSESQLEGFIALFEGVYSESKPAEKNDFNDISEKKAAALERIEQIRKKITPFPTDFDERAEYLSYLDERYGV